MKEEARTVVESTLVPHTAFNAAMKRVAQCLSYSLESTDPICLALVGESRTGKSRVLEETALLMPRHRTREGAVVPILRVTTPSRPTVKGVAGLMLKALGDPKWEAGTEINRTSRLEDQLQKCKTRMIMLDEFQHFFDKGKQTIFHEVADWLKTTIDQTKVTLVASGLESCLPVILRNEQLSGRFQAPVFMPRFNWLDEVGREEFVAILDSFDETMSAHFDMPKLSGDEMAFRFWCASGGLMGHLTKLLRQAVWSAFDAKQDSIPLEAFAAAHKAAIWSRTGDAVLDSPFDRKFSIEPTQEKIAAGLLVGVREVETEGRTGRRRSKSKEQSLGQVLRASGA